jgi:murein DD-endopeptidase MepM/ murein hydrolase activator NlpD
MTSVRRFLSLAVALLALVALVGAVALVLPARSAGASTSDDLDAARQKLTQARDAANDTAAKFSEADHQLEQTRDDIARLKDSIAATRARAQGLRDYMRQRALYAYTHPGTSLEALVDATDSVDAARRQQLLDQANQTDSGVVKQLAVANGQLKTQQGELERQEREQAAISDELDTKLAALQANQAQVQHAVDELQSKLDAEIAAAQLAAAQRRAALEAEKAALSAQQQVATGGPGQIIANPVGGAFQCPVSGAAYSDDYGGPSGHPGIDMMVPIGTPAVAVKGGTVRYVPNEGAGGNTAYLQAVDGNTYFYAHFSQFVGEGRSVAQGEVIGLTGMTGNASAPHLHFEIRLGGDNGNKTDPYPTLRAAGC